MSVQTGIDTTGLTFFFLDEGETVEAMVARIVPGDESDPGAREADVLTYIDRALSGAYRDWQAAYREGIRALNAYTVGKYGRNFGQLADSDQDVVIAALERGSVASIDASGGTQFFQMVWAHTIEGMFCDPTYGGNRNAVGWKLLGYPGTQYGYNAEDMRYGADLSTKPIMTLGDIGKLAREKPNLFYRRSGPVAAPTSEAVPEMPPTAATVETTRSQGG